MPALSKVYALHPVTSLTFAPEDSGILLVFAGEGSRLKLFSRKSQKLLHVIPVFRKQAIHGVHCVVDNVASSDSEATLLKCLIWGGRSLAVLAIRVLVSINPHAWQVTASPILKETLSSDWILHGLLSPPHTWTDGFDAPFVQAVVVSAHNDLIAVELSRVFKTDEVMRVNLSPCANGPKSILYCAQCLWRESNNIVVAAGTMFGEIQMWRHRLDRGNKAQHDSDVIPQGILTQSLLGHEGSVFGVDIIEPLAGDTDERYLLASCSDERTVRLWDVSESFATAEPQNSRVQQNMDTGFGNKFDNVNRGAIASAMGHLSRIWSVKGTRASKDQVKIFSFGEDVTVNMWNMLSSSGDLRAGSGDARPQLELTRSMASHNGKNIWSSDIFKQGDGSVFTASGGADGRIALHQPVGDIHSQRWSFPYKELHQVVSAEQPSEDDKSGGSAQAIFDAMKGTWHIQRQIVSVLPSYPSGTFEGTATLVERDSTDSEYDQELLYSESGTFTTTTGLVLQGSRRYAYRYQKTSNRITAWFVTLDEDAKVDYLFHQVTFDPAQGRQNVSSCDVVASGHHLCIKDDYNAEYSFPFHTNTLDTWSLTYLVSGPSKDYTASATFTRRADSSKESYPSEIAEPAIVSSTVARDEAIKAFSWLGNCELIASTSTGHVLLGTFPSSDINSSDNTSPRIRWRILQHEQGLSSYSMISRVSEDQALISGKDGSLWGFERGSTILSRLHKCQTSIAGMFVFAAHGHHGASNGVLVTCLGNHQGTVLFLKSNSSQGLNTPAATFNLNFSHTPLVTSVCYLAEWSLLLVGFRTGAICAYDLCQPNSDEPIDACCTALQIHHRDAVTSIRTLTSSEAHEETTILTTGRDGFMTVHNLSISRTHGVNIELRKVHELQPPLGQMVEGASINSVNNDILIWGFKGKNFVLWNSTQQREVMSMDCGGSHRSWAFLPSAEATNSGSFVWTKASACHALIQSECSHKILQAGSHGRDIRCIASRKWSKNSTLVATGSEDTNIRLAIYSNEESADDRLRTVCILSKHVAGVQQVKWSHDGTRLFSCGGQEQFFVWNVRSVPSIEVGVVFEASCPPVTEISSDLRIMDFTVATSGSYGGSDQEGFIITMIYADSTIREWYYDPVSCAFTLVVATTYNTNCLTQVDRLEFNSTPFSLIAATDGHLALWPVIAFGLNQSEATEPHSMQPLIRHRVHQNSIKTFTTHQVSETCSLVITGGDDNALGLTLISMPPGAAGSFPMSRSETLLIPKAHAASITAVQLLPTTHDVQGKHTSETRLKLLSASNDQILRVWDITIGDIVEGIDAVKVVRGERFDSEVADISCMEVVGAAGDDRARGTVMLAGVGLEMWTPEFEATVI